MDYQKCFDIVMKTVMPQSFPVGVKMIKKDDPFPEKVTRPGKFGIKVALCQWTTMTRRWGWVMGATAEDISCVPCLVGLGFKKVRNKADFAQFIMDMGYGDSQELASTLGEQIETLPPGEIKGIVTFPLDKAPVDPDIVLIYGNPAQMSRLAGAYVHGQGRLIHSKTGFGLSCVSSVLPFLSQEPTFIHPGRGERMLAGTDDSEMCLSIPASYLESIVDGLEKTQKKGIRYPMQGYLIYEAPVIPPMKALEEKLLDV